MKRWIVLVLLVANLLIAGWLLARPHAPAPTVGVPLVEPADAPRLRLVAELAPEERAALARGADPGVPPTAASGGPEAGALAEIQPETISISPGPLVLPTLCSTWGPLSGRSEAMSLARLLREAGATPLLREEAGQLRSGFWVYLPPLPTREAAEAVAAELRAAGAGELFIVTAAEQRHAISLGLFSTADRADQRAAEVGKLGYRPRVAERFRDAAVFWLDLAEPAAWREAGGAPRPELPEGALRLETPCPEVSP